MGVGVEVEVVGVGVEVVEEGGQIDKHYCNQHCYQHPMFSLIFTCGPATVVEMLPCCVWCFWLCK